MAFRILPIGKIVLVSVLVLSFCYGYDIVGKSFGAREFEGGGCIVVVFENL